MNALNEQKTQAAAKRIVSIALAGRAGLGRILDIGCGAGQVLLAAQPYARSLSGIDLDERILDVARRALPGASLIAGNIDSALPFQERSFDTVFLCDVIEHLHNPFDALVRARAVLEDDGTLIVTTPNANAVMRRLLGEAWYGLSDESHVLFFTRFTLEHLLRKTGFCDVSLRTLGATGNAVADVILESFRSGGTLVAVGWKRSGGTAGTSNA